MDLVVGNNDVEFAEYLLRRGIAPRISKSVHFLSSTMNELFAFFRLKEKLYPTEDDGKRTLTDLDHALRDGDIGESKKLFAKLRGKANERDLWLAAVNQKRPDVARALLLLCPESIESLTQPQFRSVLRNAHALQDKALSDVIKEYPYQPFKLGLPRQYNNLATFTNTYEPIACVELTSDYLEQMVKDPERIKFSFDRYKSIDAIANNVTMESRNFLAKFKEQSSERYLVDNDKLGNFLIDQFGAMRQKKELTRLMLVSTTTHVMGLGLRIKEKSGQLWHVVKMFDPNMTTTHTRCKGADMEIIGALTMKSLLSSHEHLQHFYPEPNAVSLIHVRSHASQQLLEPHGEQSPKICLTSNAYHRLTPTVVYHFLCAGLSGELEKLKHSVQNLSHVKQLALIDVGNGAGVGGFYMAMQNRHADTVVAYADLLTLLPENDRIALMLKKAPNGATALYPALQFGYADMVAAFRHVLKLAPPESRAAIINAPHSSGISPLMAGILQGNEAAVRAFGDLLVEVPEELRASSLDMTSGGHGILATAFQQGCAGALDAYLDLLQLAPKEEYAKLLAAYKGAVGDQ